MTHTINNRIKPSKLKFEFKNRESRRSLEIASATKTVNQYEFNSISFNGPIQFDNLLRQIKNCVKIKNSNSK